MNKLFMMLRAKLEQFEAMSDEKQIAKLMRLKKLFPKLTIFIEDEELN